MCLNSDGNIAIADLVNDTPQPPISDQTRHGPGENTITKELQEHQLFTQTVQKQTQLPANLIAYYYPTVLIIASRVKTLLLVFPLGTGCWM